MRIRSGSPPLRLLLLLAVLSLAVPVPADAQYFGRNKVQYEDFDFRVLDTDHFALHHYASTPRGRETMGDAARMMERWHERHARLFGAELEAGRPLILYTSHADFQQTNTTQGLISQGTGGFTESTRDRIVMPLAESLGQTDHVLGHELVHAFQFELALQGGAGYGGGPRLPLWLIEGMAEYLSVGPVSGHTAMWLRDAVHRDDLPDLEALSTDPDYFPYRWGHGVWAWIAGNLGDRAVPDLFRTAARQGIEPALRSIGTTSDSLSADWHDALRSHYGPLLEDRVPASESATRILGPETGTGTTNLAPSLGPNGNWVVFLGRRDLFTLDWWVADARTGEVRGRLASDVRSAHFDALTFTNSAGAWSPDGARFAFPTVLGGDGGVGIADVEEMEVVRSIRPRGADAVYGVAWSPDGSSLVVSASRDGITDLLLVDVETGETRALTEDRYTELHPSWSPDGTRIVFATDRPDGRYRPGREGEGPGLDDLSLPRPGIGVLEVDRGTVTVDRPFPGAKHIDPVYGPDGRTLHFVADPDGFSDVYRRSLETGETRRLTKVHTGVSGITALSPAMTLASGSGRMVFTVFRDGDYLGYAMSPEDVASTDLGVPASPGGTPPGAVLPPADRAEPSRVAELLRSPEVGLQAEVREDTHDYNPGLGLDYVAPPTAGVSVGRLGTQLGGSVAAVWSDLLGNQQLTTVLQAQGSVEDIGGIAFYENRDDRLNWGLLAGRIPSRTGFTRIGTTEVDGRQARAVDLVIARTAANRAGATASYPFSRTRRLEGEIGYTHYTFDREVIRTVILDGVVVDENRFDVEAPASLDLAQASAALVGDYSFFGFTSPVRGGRSRLEVGYTTGTLDFATALADWRRYLFWKPVTLAVRGLHYGRYGGDAETDRLSPLFLGSPNLVRGYESGSFEGSECTDVTGEPDACPEFDRLVGSRLGVANLELRVPFIGTEDLGLLDWGFLPTELSLFVDAGVAWTSEESPELELTESSPERIPVVSSGVSARVNLLGAFVGEIYWAYPFQRPDAGGQLGFQIAPGW